MKTLAEKILCSIGAAVILCGLWSCSQDSGYIAISGYAQGGTYTVKLNMEGVGTRPEQIKTAIDSLLMEIDNTLSGYNKGSQLSRFNSGEAIEPNAMFTDIYKRSRGFFEATDGAVDVAAGPLFDAWGFGFTKDSLPDASQVQRLLDSCGMDRMPESLEDAVGKGFTLNFNAVAQGYSCDVVADYLYSIGVEDMLVDIGEIYCDGLNPSGKPWSIAIDTPVDGNQDLGAQTSGVWRSSGGPCSIVTSGNYRKFYVKDGKKYAHTIDPRTGWPVSHNLLSATILASDGITADAYATYCMVIGLEASKEFLASREDLEGYLIYDENGGMKSWFSEGFNADL